MRTIDRARRQYGLSEDHEIPEYMSRGDPPPYQSPDDYAPSPAPIPTQQRDTIMAQPVIDSGVVVAGDDRALPYSVYRELMLKQDELQSHLDLCLSWADKQRKKERPIATKGPDVPWSLTELRSIAPNSPGKSEILGWLKDNASAELLEQFGLTGMFKQVLRRQTWPQLVEAYAAAIKGGAPKLKEKMVGGSNKKKKKTRRKSKKKKTRRKSKKSRNKRSK